MSDEQPSLWAEIIGRLAYEFSLAQPLIPTYTHLVVSALFPIYAGAHASLTRPSSAAVPDKASKGSKSKDNDEDSEEEEEVQQMEGLSPSDALMFPILAGCTLAGLYFLIKWLQDPTLLNKVLGWYFALFGVFSVAKIIGDSLDFAQSFVFPRRYASDGALWLVRGQESKAITLGGDEKKDTRYSPLPGAFSKIPLPTPVLRFLWVIREVPRQKWIAKLYVHKITALRAKVSINSIVAAVSGLAVVLYFNTVDKPWFLTNLMGFGFSYGALQIMSPITFATGSLILAALFFYDIYFVFYTPMMVTVAKSLDVPIKLVFPRPSAPSDDTGAQSFAMLGLGDIVLPGIMIGLALRFDLYMFYLRKQKVIKSEDGSESTVVKAKYTSVSNRWGEKFWTHSLLGSPLTPSLHSSQSPITFPKPYFNAALIGYITGMLATLGVMHVFQHAQPALLYLVPGVLIFVWMTAIFRGELKEMWNFSEAVEEDATMPKDSSTNQDKYNTTEQSRSAQSFFFSGKQLRTADLLGHKFAGSIQEDNDRHQIDSSADESEHLKAKTRDGKKKSKATKILSRQRGREVFSVSIEAPFRLSHPNTVSETEKSKEQSYVDIHVDTTVDSNGQPKGKRVRLS